LLKPIIPFLPETPTLRHQITAHSLDYAKLQSIALQVREQLGIGDQAILEYEHLIGEFKSCGAILIPVLWGRKDRHENALHILLKRENITFIYINLDTRLEDFKFWMAHELAHVYTPELAGTDEGEDFADAFAGALLFPEVCAENIYREVLNTSENHIISVLKRSSEHYNISINTIYQQVQQYAIAKKIAPLSLPEKTVHAVRNSNPSPLVSEALFDPLPPKPDQYISGCKNIFQSDFFKGLERMINELGTGHSYIQQVLDIPLQDAVGLHQELSR
jgi:Zn-dependent peptidase ImmA (M78 family)